MATAFHKPFGPRASVLSRFRLTELVEPSAAAASALESRTGTMIPKRVANTSRFDGLAVVVSLKSFCAPENPAFCSLLLPDAIESLVRAAMTVRIQIVSGWENA